GTPPSELAHHWYEARRLPEAFSAAIEAGFAAERASALAEAVVHLGMALDLWDTVPDAAERSPMPWVDLSMRAADAALLSGDFDRGLALVRQAIAGVDPEQEPVKAGLLH